MLNNLPTFRRFSLLSPFQNANDYQQIGAEVSMARGACAKATTAKGATVTAKGAKVTTKRTTDNSLYRRIFDSASSLLIGTQIVAETCDGTKVDDGAEIFACNAATSFIRAFVHNAALLLLVWASGYFQLSFLWAAIIAFFWMCRQREKLATRIFSALQRLMKSLLVYIR